MDRRIQTQFNPSVLFFQVVVHTIEGERLYRISPWAKYVTRDEKSVIYDWVHYDPPHPYIVSCSICWLKLLKTSSNFLPVSTGVVCISVLQ